MPWCGLRATAVAVAMRVVLLLAVYSLALGPTAFHIEQRDQEQDGDTNSDVGQGRRKSKSVIAECRTVDVEREHFCRVPWSAAGHDVHGVENAEQVDHLECDGHDDD